MAKKAVAKTKKQSSNNFKKYIKWFWITFASGIGAIALVFLLASWGVFGELPTFEILENPQTDLASEIITSDGKTLGKFYLDANRTPVSFEELPDYLVKALIATEDERYYDHSGIDARGTLRAVAYMGSKGGASTITQQLAKLLFTERASSNIVARVIQKIKEWIIAIRLEKQYTKEEIIAMYLNIYDFGYNGDGIRSAARIYFGKEPKDLDVKESAMLVGMLQNSSYFDPFKREELTTKRRNTVLGQMAKNEFIPEKLKDSLQKQDLGIDYHPESHSQGIATYFRMYLQNWFKEWANNPKNFKPDGKKYNIFLDGLKVYTTIDSEMQAYAEEAVNEHMPRLQAEFFHQNTPERNPTAPFLGLTKGEVKDELEKAIKRSERWRHMKVELKKKDEEIRASFDKETEMRVFSWKGDIDTVMTPLDSIKYYKMFLRTGMMSMEPQTGHVKAWVGGINYRHFQYDQVKQGARQVGSTFKPFVYAAAIDQLHLSPCDTLPDVQFCIEANKYGNPEPWCPKNSNGKFTGKMMSLRNGLANSVNSITARLMDKIGPQPVVNLVKKLGVESHIEPVPAIALGTADISVYEMVGAYGAFANQGVYVKPVMVTRIEDKNGTVLYEYVPETRDVVSDEVAYATIKLLEGVTHGGSGTRLRTVGADKYSPMYREIITGYPYEFKNPIAGKTGTTQNQSDGWFMGMVPNLVTGVWVGGEDRATHFRSITYGQGASMALPIWALYMRKCYENEELGVSKEGFTEPKEMTIRTDCSKTDGVESDQPKQEEVDIDF